MVILAESTILVPTEHEYIDLSYSVLSIEDSSITKEFFERVPLCDHRPGFSIGIELLW